MYLVYLDNDINGGFIADRNKMCITASLIDRKDVNNNYCNMHLSNPSGHSTPFKLNRKISLALRANKIKKKPRRLPMARGTKKRKCGVTRKEITQGLRAKTLLYNLRRRKKTCQMKLPRNWKNRYKRYSAKRPPQIGFDHKLIMAKLKLRLKKGDKASGKLYLNTEKLENPMIKKTDMKN
ncbi:hypothetical protein HELRODRAFT_169177 [Helobdella robusta]|uniref:Uncharacterized protein n=1 Tax=Helobdella robusta TaxID=6412 RepID=T1F1I9_HELRO|nr:hypothetical protein HELRODRAFT_169177 [Helobdella robusta]ESO08362.1 hypothetical protein HELRODRAFT_169177 [Helobdella robusta]